MSDSIKEDENKILKSSNTNDNENKDDDKSKEPAEINKENGKTTVESFSKSDIKNEKTLSPDSTVDKSKNSEPPVSVCFKETSEIVSKESYVSMLEDINLFFSNLKELESKRTSKRKFKCVLEDSNENSDKCPSEESFQPVKKVHLDTSDSEAISFEQSQISSTISETCQPADASTESPENIGSLSPNVSSGAVKCTLQEPSNSEHRAESHSLPMTCQVGTSSENPSIEDQPSLDSETVNIPEHLGNEDNHPDPQGEGIDQPPEPLDIEYYDRELVELNGVRPHRFPGTIIVQIIIPIFEFLLNDLMELRSFLDGRQILQPSLPAEEAAIDTSIELTLLDRQLAWIAVEFGTGVESVTAQTTREAVAEWESQYIPRLDSEPPSEFSDNSEEHAEYEENSPPSESLPRGIETESNSNEISESPAIQPRANPAQSCLKSDAVFPPNSSQFNPETANLTSALEKGESSTAVQFTKPESSSNSIAENTRNASPDPVPTNVVALPADSLLLNTEIDLLRNPSDISPILLDLNTEGRKCLNSCIETTKHILSTCLTHGIDSFHASMVQHMKGIQNFMRRLIALRQECSEKLKKCPNKNSIAGVIYILKVKTHIAKLYNQLLIDLLTLNNNFTKAVKDKIPIESVD